MKKLNNFLKSKGKLLIALLVSLVLLAILIVFFNTPERKIERGLKKADAAFSEGSFVLAGSLYDKVIEIDNYNIKAYLGLVSSYALSDNEDAKALGASAYERAVMAFKALDTETYNANNELIVSTLRFGEDLLKESDGYLSLMKLSYDLSLKDTTVGLGLSDAYILDAQAAVKEENYKRAMDDYLAAEELNGKDERINEGVSKFIVSYLRQLSRDEEYTLAKDLIAKFQPVLSDVDFVDVINEVLEREELSKTKERLLKSVYDSLIDYYNYFVEETKDSTTFAKDINATRGYDCDFSAIMALDGADDANLLSQSLAAGRYLYAPDGFNDDYTGIAAGLYPYGNLWENEEGKTMIAYYFFIGNYVNGQRTGKGVSFMKTGDMTYELFEGQWVSDAPEGNGIFYISGLDYKRATFGVFKAGYANGTMTEVIRTSDYPDELFVGTYEATDGIPKEVPAKTDEYEIFFPEGDAKLIDVLPSKTAGYDLYLTSTWTEGVKIGAIGYR